MIVLGSIFLLDNHNQTNPTKAAKAITKKEFAELFTPFGSNGNPKTVLFKFSAAKSLSDPPLCSKNAQKTIENNIKLFNSVYDLFKLEHPNPRPSQESFPIEIQLDPNIYQKTEE